MSNLKMEVSQKPPPTELLKKLDSVKREGTETVYVDAISLLQTLPKRHTT